MMRAVGLAVAVLLLSSCGDTGSADRPSTASTRVPTSLPSPTATVPDITRTPERGDTTSTSEPANENTSEPANEGTSEPARGENTSPTETENEPPRSSAPVAAPSPTASESTRTETSEPTRTESSEPTETTSTTETAPTNAPTTSPSAQPTSAETDGAPSWLRWLLVALVIGLAVAIPLLVRASHRREWRDELAAAENEVVWFARGLIPQLGQMGSLAEVAGGWNLAESRVAAVEDRLTALEPSAPDEDARLRALDLRDAVRAARGQIQGLLEAGRPVTMTQDLAAVATQLEQVLAAAPPTV